MALGAILQVLSAAPTAAQASKDAQNADRNPRWAPIRHVFNQGDAEGEYFRVNLPRTDLEVRIGNDTLDAGIELTSYLGFIPSEATATGVIAVGEVVAVQDEVPAILAEAQRQAIRVTAIHNHLLGETPHVMYVHVMAEGAADSVATKLRSVFAKTATPLTPPAKRPSRGNWSAIDAVLGPHSEAEGPVAEYVFPRRESLRLHGVQVKSVGALETASEVAFQQLGNGRVATVGELYLLPTEVEAVLRTLDAHGLHVTALHNHMLDDGPPHYWVHWYATGDGTTLARGVAAALTQMHSATKAVAEGP
jgi:hypothetical protein